jgi:cytochrome bd-type quinol oxidase subunit 2
MSVTNGNSIIDSIGKVAAVAAAYYLGTMISGMVITAAGMPWPAFPNPPSQATGLALNVISSILMAGCLALLASGIRASQIGRWLAVAAFSYVIFGLNNQIEAAAFTSFGGTATMLVFFVTPCLLGAATAAWLIRPPTLPEARQASVCAGPFSTWWWRVVLAWLAFPVIYIFFGMLVAPVVVPFYQDPSFGLKLPGWGTLMPVVLLRSALALAVTLPILLLWSRSRRSLMVALAVAFFAMMGLIGLATTTFFPPVMRIVHSLEILGDSMVYAWVLVALFIPKAKAASATASPTNAG